jgi:hypothetical protein
VRIALLVLLAGCWQPSPAPEPPWIQNIAPRGPVEREPMASHSVWRGFYECAQGKTALQLVLDLEADGRARVIFDFGPDPGNPDVPPGSYRLTGTSREDRAKLAIELVPDAWILQPPGYTMVGLAGEIGSRRQRMRGRITHPSCTTFDVQRVE